MKRIEGRERGGMGDRKKSAYLTQDLKGNCFINVVKIVEFAS